MPAPRTATAPKISVITGYFNRAQLVQRTIESILEQTFTDFELLIFDDASTDQTAATIRQIIEQKNDQRVSAIYHEHNIGFTQGMIHAISKARGEYLAVQGSGDVAMPTLLERLSAVLDQDPEVGAVGCWYVNVNENTGVRRLRRPQPKRLAFKHLLHGNLLSHGGMLLRRSAYSAAGGYRSAFKFSQDYDLWLRMARISQLAVVPEVLYERYVLADGESFAPEKYELQARYQLLCQRINILEPSEQEELLRRLEIEGPTEMVPASDRELQSLYFWAALGASLWGREQHARDLAENNIVNGFRRGIILLAASFFDKRWALPMQLVLRKVIATVYRS